MINQSANPTAQWKGLFRLGAWAGICMLVIMAVQIVVFTLWPPPQTPAEYFALFQENWLLGLLSMDLLYIINDILLVLIYLALYFALKPAGPSIMLVALVLGLLGIAAYFASNPAFEMLALSGRYTNALDEMRQMQLLSAGQVMLERYTGTAFLIYYELNAIALLMMAYCMLRSPIFSRATAWMGLIAGILMLIPSTAGTLGLIFSLLSLIPWAVFLVLVIRTLFRLDM